MDSAATIWKGWQVEERIGSGGAGDVYKIRRDEYGLVSYAAMKIIEIPRDPREVAELKASGMGEEDIRCYYREMVGSLRREIQIMEDLKGAANIVSIEDYVIREHQEDIGWSIYIRMELLQSISDYRERTGGLTLEEVLRLGVDICAALENCREAGITHRDVKPDNIFRSRYGTFKLGDFGIARQLDSATLRMHTRKGTSTYMAPEVIRKEKYDASVDLYSLGLVLYRYLNHNRMPYMPQFPERIRPEDFGRAMTDRLAGEPMLPPAQADDELAAIILRACAYAPEDRYEDPRDLRVDLDRYLHSLQEEHRAPGGGVPKEMYVAYDPQNMKQSYGQDVTGLAGEETLTMVEPPVTVAELEPVTSAVAEPAMAPSIVAEPEASTPVEPEVEVATVATPAPAAVEGAPKENTTVHRSNSSANPKPADPAPTAPKQPKAGRLSRKWRVLIIVVLVFAAAAGGFVYLQSQYTRVPGVERLPKKEAKAAIEQAGLTMGVDRKEYSDDVAKGSVISQSPGKGHIQRRQTVVHVVISKGTNKVTVPDVVGRSREEAVQMLESAHLKVNVETTKNILKASGVVDQSEKAGTRVIRDTEVTITVNESTVRDRFDDWFGAGPDENGGYDEGGDY